MVEALRGMGHPQGVQELSLVGEDHRVMVVVCPINAGKPHAACSLSAAHSLGIPTPAIPARDSCPRFLPAIPARDSCPRFLPAIPGLLVAPLPALAARPSLSNVRQELERRKANPPGAVVPTELAEPFRPRADG